MLNKLFPVEGSINITIIIFLPIIIIATLFLDRIKIDIVTITDFPFSSRF